MKQSFGPLHEAYQAGLKGKPCPLMFREPTSAAHFEYLKGCEQARIDKELKALDKRLAKLVHPPFAAVLQVAYGS